MAIVIEQAGAVLTNGWYRASWYLYTGNQLGMFTTAWDVTNVVGAPTLGDLAYTLITNTNTPLEALIGQNVTILGVKVNSLQRTPAALPGVATSGSVGANTQDLMPLQISGIISWGTIFAGRAYRGRIYVPFPTVNFGNTEGAPTTAYQTALQSLGNALYDTGSIISGGGSATLDLGIWSRKTKTGTLVYQVTAQLKWAGQRRRGSYGKTNGNAIPL